MAECTLTAVYVLAVYVLAVYVIAVYVLAVPYTLTAVYVMHVDSSVCHSSAISSKHVAANQRGSVECASVCCKGREGVREGGKEGGREGREGREEGEGRRKGARDLG